MRSRGIRVHRTGMGGLLRGAIQRLRLIASITRYDQVAHIKSYGPLREAHQDGLPEFEGADGGMTFRTPLPYLHLFLSCVPGMLFHWLARHRVNRQSLMEIVCRNIAKKNFKNY